MVKKTNTEEQNTKTKAKHCLLSNADEFMCSEVQAVPVPPLALVVGLFL